MTAAIDPFFPYEYLSVPEVGVGPTRRAILHHVIAAVVHAVQGITLESHPVAALGRLGE